MKLYLTHKEFCEIIVKSNKQLREDLRQRGLSEEKIKLRTCYWNFGAGDFSWEGRELVDLTPYFISQEVLDEAIQKYGDRKEN